MFCSTIIPTVGRHTLRRAVQSVLAQTWPTNDFEIIVVNDSGQSLDLDGLAVANNLHIINTVRRERSIARNSGAAVARGRYLHFLDDDDWMAPGFLQNMSRLIELNDAAWVYGVSQLVDRQDRPLLQLEHRLSGNCFLQVMAGEWIPLQASLIERTAFTLVGGFNPLLTGPEDIDLLRRIACKYDIAESKHVVTFIQRGEEGSTTDYSAHVKASRQAREQILNKDKVFDRLIASAHTSKDFGRLLRIFLTSFLWNLHAKRPFSAMSRLLNAFAALFRSGLHLFSTSYWLSLKSAYASPTFERGWQKRAIDNELSNNASQPS